MSESNGDELDTSTALGEESSEEAPPRVVVKRYRKANPATSLAQQPSSSQEHLFASTSAPPLMQSKPKFGPGPRGYAPPHMTINPYPLPATLRTQMHITAHWQDRLQPQETTYRPKLPPFAKGTPLAPPRGIATRPRCDMPVLHTGGQPPPRSRPTPRSLMFRQPGRVAAAHAPPTQPQSDAPYRKKPSAFLSASAGITAQRAMPLSPAPVREQAPTTTKARNAAARKLAEQTFIDLANRIGPACEAFLQLSASANFASHLRRLVAPFAVSTLQRYLRASHVFVDFLAMTASQSGKPCLSNIKISMMADYMLACSASKKEDREVHMMSPVSSIKALRWIAKTLQWQALSEALSSPVISAYGKQSREYDRKESTPIPMALLACWERTICSAEVPLTTKLFLGAVLLCTHASLRFGDAQRIEWSTLQLSAQGLHGTAYATKTTKCGQPFACTWHGITGRCVPSSWLLQWLSCLVEVGTSADLEPDFLFFHADLDSHKHPRVFPCSYAHALLCLRFLAQKDGLTESEAFALTLHSMKSTMLAAAAQLQFNEQARLAQGHHRDSLRLYSRNDTLEALRLQHELSTQLARGWRPQRSMARGGAAPVPEPPFSTPPQPPQQLLDNEQLHTGTWAVFMSRHENMQRNAEPPSPEPVAQHNAGPDTDSEAELVEKYAMERSQSSEEESEEPTAPAPDEELFVCSGPWNALHSPTRSSHLEFELLYGSNPTHADVLIAACGADLGSMPVVIKTHDPVSACRRKACVLARASLQA